MARTEAHIRKDIDKTRAELSILNNYVETYEILTDNNQFSNQSMADKNLAQVLKVIDFKEHKLNGYRSELHNYRKMQ